MSEEEFDIDNAWFGIDGGALGIHDGVIAWVMNDFRIVNRYAGVEGWEDVAEKTDEWINEHGVEVMEGAVAELSLLAEAEGIDGIEVPETEGDWRD